MRFLDITGRRVGVRFALPEGRALVATDTEFQVEERQRLLAQYAEIATLAGALAHEIKTPLSTIGMNLDLLAEDLEGKPEARDRRMLMMVQTVQRECHHLNDILE